MPQNRGQNPLTILLLIAVVVLLIVLVARQRSPRPTRSDYPASRVGDHARREHREEGYSRNYGSRGYSSNYGNREQNRRSASPACTALGVSFTSQYFASWTPPSDGDCHLVERGGELFPDPRCTPGGINPSVTSDILRDPSWRTRCVRNRESSESQKHIAYRWYSVQKPDENSGQNQVCELDHLVPLELGGADGLGNIWPECGPNAASLPSRNFKIKDRVENYLAAEVRAGRMPLLQAQRGIAENWLQFLPAANQYCEQSHKCSAGVVE